MTRTRDVMLSEPAALIRRMFRDLDPWSEARFPFTELRKTLTDVPWMPPLELTERDNHLIMKLDLPGLQKENIDVTLTVTAFTEPRRCRRAATRSRRRDP